MGRAEQNRRFFAVERDGEGIRLAALEMFEESLYVEERERTRRAIEQSADPRETAKQAAVERKFAAGYYVWVGYLFGLEVQIQAGIDAGLTRADLVGLLAIREARMQFENDHPRCRCGRRMRSDAEKFQGMCRECKERQS